MNNPPRKRRESGSAGFTPPPEAFDYDADVTKEAVKIVQDRADKARSDEDFDVVEGYVGVKR
jgi:hypothetical protein